MINKEIQSIDIILESGATINIPIKYLGLFKLQNITEDLVVCGTSTSVRTKKVNDIIIQIYKEFKKCPINIAFPYLDADIDTSLDIFDSLIKYRDISMININYTDDTHECFFVTFDGRSCIHNSHMSYFIPNKGPAENDLFIRVNKDYTAKEYIKQMDIFF